jgi:hypothetical protein
MCSTGHRLHIRFENIIAHLGWFQSAQNISGLSCKPEKATRFAGTMLPDILHYDPTRPASYPENGRALTDDVVDFFLPLLTNGKVTRDNVGSRKDLLASFPYVAPPHQARSAENLAA